MNYQYLRTWRLLVTNTNSVSGSRTSLDLSDLRITFSIKRTNYQTPNIADIKVYNMSSETIKEIRSGFKRISFQAGYGKDNEGVIFAGNIQQTLVGRDTGTDTYIQFIASDGSQAYNYAFINKSLVSGTTAQNDLNESIKTLKEYGVQPSLNTNLGATQKRPRGKVLYGNTKDVIRTTTRTTNNNWTIENEQLVIIPVSGYLNGQAVEINETNGMIGSPQQTLDGVNVKCLLNPKLSIGTRVKLNNNQIKGFVLDLQGEGSAKNIPNSLNSDGVYFVGVIEYTGDTRGPEWYSTLTMYTINPALTQNAAVTGGA